MAKTTKMVLECPVCGGRVLYARIKTHDWICRKCGLVIDKPVRKEEE